MEKGYYKPEPDEICIGFELEDNGCSTLPENEQVWQKTVVSPAIINTILYDLMCSDNEASIRNNSVRVKFIDREDIEECGFVFVGEKPGMYMDFERPYIDKRMTKNKCGIHFTRIGWMLITIYCDEDAFEDRITKFSGTTQNKMELKKLLKQLGV